jgi:hypothetical protein
MPSVLDYGTLSAVDPARAIAAASTQPQQAQQPVDTSAGGQAAAAVQAINQNAVIGSEFGEVDRPSRGGYTEPNWNIGKWGANLEGFDNEGVALPAEVLKNYGNHNDKDFATNFNNQYDVVVTNPKTGAQTITSLKDIGPGKSTGAGLDMLGGTRTALGLPVNYKGPVTYAVVPKGSAASLSTAGTASSAAPGEAPLAPWDIQMTQLQANPQSATIGALFQQVAQREAGGPTAQVTSTDQAATQIAPAGESAYGQSAWTASGKFPAITPTFSWTLPQQSSLREQVKPETFGLRVATDDDVSQYQQYVKNGGDPNAIDIYDKLAVALKQDPQFLLRPENVNVYKDLIKNPIKDQSAGLSTEQKVGNAIGQGWKGLGDIANDVKAYVGTAWNDAAPAARYLFAKATGQVPDPDATHGMADLNATNAQGSAKLVSDLYSMAGGTLLNTERLGTNIAETFTSDPAKKAALEQSYLLDEQKHMANLQGLYDFGQTLQAQTANFYTWTGAFADLGQQLKTAAPDPKAVAGFSQIAQFAPMLGEGAKALSSLVVKPLMVDSGLEALEDAAVASTRKFTYDNTQTIPPNVGEEAANPNYVAVRSAQAALAPDARAANANFSQAQTDLANKLTSLQKIAGDPGTVAQVQAGLANLAGNGADLVGNVAKGLSSVKDRLLNITSLGNPEFRAIQEKMLGIFLYSHGVETGHPFVGRLMEAGLDMAEDGPKIAEATSSLSDLMRVYGREKLYGENSIPFWTRVDQVTGKLGPRMASFLDSPAVLTFYNMGKGAAAGAAVGGALGAAASPDDMLAGGVQGAMLGGVLGMAGGGFGQWLRYQDPQAHYMALRGDWKRTSDLMGAAEKEKFLQLPSHDQLMIGTYMQQHPGLRMNLVNDPAGPSGFHYFDEADRPTVQINLARPDSTARALFTHELMHQVQTSGMLPDVYDALLGNPQRGTLGQYTAKDINGNPIVQGGANIDPSTGRYFPNQDFENYKTKYTTNLARSGEPFAQVSNLHIAKEIYAEHGADYMLSGKAAVDASSAYRPGWMNSEGLKNSLANLGFSFNDNGGMVQGSGLFDNLQRNSALDNLTQRYFQTRFNDRKFGAPAEDFQANRKFSKEDLRGNAPDVWLDTAPEFIRDANGNAVRDKNTGDPLYRSQKEVKEYNAKLADDMLDRISALPEDRKADIGHQLQPNGATFVRYLPAELRDALAKTNQYNPHQIDGLSAMSENMADKSGMGTQFRLFYNKALTANKRYGQFEGEERFVTPYGFEITKDKNVNIKAVDFAQLNNNYLRNAKRAPYNDLWGGNVSEFNTDANTYFKNHARGNPGADGIGVPKRDAINSLLGLETQLHRDSNPLLAGADNPRARSIMKSFRIDRASQIEPKEKDSPFTDLSQYTLMNKNFRPRRAGEVAPEAESGTGEVAPNVQPGTTPATPAPAEQKARSEPFSNLPDEALPKLSEIAHTKALAPGTHFLDPKGVRRKIPNG